MYKSDCYLIGMHNIKNFIQIIEILPNQILYSCDLFTRKNMSNEGRFFSLFVVFIQSYYLCTVNVYSSPRCYTAAQEPCRQIAGSMINKLRGKTLTNLEDKNPPLQLKRT